MSTSRSFAITTVDEHVTSTRCPDRVVTGTTKDLDGLVFSLHQRLVVVFHPVAYFQIEHDFVVTSTAVGRRAHVLFVALDLAQDRSRGREILDAWQPTEARRVW